MEDLEEEIIDITATGEELWQVYGGLQRKLNQVFDCIKQLMPPVKTDILKNTGAGPGVGRSRCRSEKQGRRDG